MRKRIGTAAFFILAIALLGRPHDADAEDAGAPQPVPACMRVRSEARNVGYGYNHVVVLQSGCTKDATCTISTDVNPAPTTVDVAKGTTQEVVTFAASPASVFNANVACRLH